MQLAAGGIFIAFRKVIGLDDAQIFKWCRVLIDGDVVDHVEGGEVQRTQILRYVRTVHALVDVAIGGEARDKHAGLALCV